MRKKVTTALVLMGGLFSVQAQITITDINLVGQGDVIEQATDNTSNAITIGSGGANQTWNYAALSEDGLDTLSYKNPTPLPGSANFPTANVGVASTTLDSSWSYFRKNTAGLDFIGSAEFIQGNLTFFSNTLTILIFPSTMGTSFTRSFNGTIVSSVVGLDLDGPGPQGIIDSIKTTRKSALTANIDGWGDITTPLGTFASLRQISTEQIVDTTWQLEAGTWSVVSSATISAFAFVGIPLIASEFDTIRTARWWTDDMTSKFVLVEMDYNTDGTVNQTLWQKSGVLSTGINDVRTATDVNVYPNPAASAITIETKLNNNSAISILDITGKLVKTVKFTARKFTMSVSDLNNGIYFYNINDENGNVLHSDKFIVAK